MPERAQSANFNLLIEPWIPVLRKDGFSDRVGVIEALEHAASIRQIALASPLDLFAVHRFILTLLYWKEALAGGVEQIRNSLMKNEKIPAAVLDGIRKEAHCFDLFDEESPFLQDPSVRDTKEAKKKSAGSLFAELATGTNIAHFHHGDDENLRLCLPCTTLGMLRVVPWTQSGGRGLTPSVHNYPPIMAIATGDNLAATLGLNLVPLDVKPGEARWSGRFEPTGPTKPIPYLEALTWNPRRIYLSFPQKGLCGYCGRRNVLTVGPKIVYENNDATKRRESERGTGKLPFVWNDPSAFYKEKGYKPAASVGEAGAINDGDLQRLDSSTSILFSKNEMHKDWRLVIAATDMQKKTFDHRELRLASLSSDAIKKLIPQVSFPPQQKGLDGWNIPNGNVPSGVRIFVREATRLLTYGDWTVLSNAAYLDMHDAPAAFDLLAGLHWGLRDKRIEGLPSRNVAWLILKLMSSMPARARRLYPGSKFSPLEDLDAMPMRQPKEHGRTSLYPVAFPRGERLEAALRDALDRNLRKRNPEPVDWIRLCYCLDQLLD